MDFNKSLLKEAENLNRASLEIIGKSVMGKELFLIRMGNGDKKLFLSAAHHANEWITALILMRFLKEADENEELLGNTEIFVLPLANPDGAALVRGEISGTFYERALKISSEFKDIPFPSGWKANILGYDLNLSYPANFYKAKRIKGSKGFVKPAPRDYPGEFPLCQPEARAIYKLVCNNDFDMLLSFHTQGKVIYHKYGNYNPKGSIELAKIMAKESGYNYEETPEESGNAGLKDWFIKKYNRPGFTIEAGQGISPLPLSDFDEIYNDNLKIILSALRY